MTSRQLFLPIKMSKVMLYGISYVIAEDSQAEYVSMETIFSGQSISLHEKTY